MRKQELPGRQVLYCLVPYDLAALHEPLRRHFADDPAVEVVVEQRSRDRRDTGERREGERPRRAADRRHIHNAAGRRIADRRAPSVPVPAPALPRKARAHAEQIVFVERVEPATERLEDIDTARLVTRIQAGDEDAFGALYVRYFDRVYAYLRIVLRDPHEAEDLAQQVFMRVCEALPRYERRTQPFRGWLFVIVRNLALSELRKRGRADLMEPRRLSRAIDVPSDEGEPPEPLDWLSDRELIMFVERLPVAQRQVLMLRHMLDLSTSEIATALGMTPVNVRSLHSRALRTLEQRLRAVGRAPQRVRGRSPLRRGVRQAPVLRARRFSLVA